MDWGTGGSSGVEKMKEMFTHGHGRFAAGSERSLSIRVLTGTKAGTFAVADDALVAGTFVVSGRATRSARSAGAGAARKVVFARQLADGHQVTTRGFTGRAVQRVMRWSGAVSPTLDRRRRGADMHSGIGSAALVTFRRAQRARTGGRLMTHVVMVVVMVTALVAESVRFDVDPLGRLGFRLSNK